MRFDCINRQAGGPYWLKCESTTVSSQYPTSLWSPPQFNHTTVKSPLVNQCKRLGVKSHGGKGFYFLCWIAMPTFTMKRKCLNGVQERQCDASGWCVYPDSLTVCQCHSATCQIRLCCIKYYLRRLIKYSITLTAGTLDKCRQMYPRKSFWLDDPISRHPMEDLVCVQIRIPDYCALKISTVYQAFCILLSAYVLVCDGQYTEDILRTIIEPYCESIVRPCWRVIFNEGRCQRLNGCLPPASYAPKYTKQSISSWDFPYTTFKEILPA